MKAIGEICNAFAGFLQAAIMEKAGAHIAVFFEAERARNYANKKLDRGPDTTALRTNCAKAL